MKRRAVSPWVLALACTLALLAGALPSRARAEGPSPSKAAPGPPVTVHGLAPLPGGAPVPLHYRPPGALAGDGGPSPVLFPAQKLTIRHNHRLHVEKLSLGCTRCHRRVKTSKSSSDRLLPRATSCDSCHGSNHRDLRAVKTDQAKLIGQCGYCHLGHRPAAGNQVARLVIPRPRLRFDHAAHAKRNIGCPQCHGLVEKIELATRDQLPRMRGCFRCHQLPQPARGDARSECSVCHLTERTGKLKTSFATGRLLPPRWLHSAAHDADWSERHKTVAGADSRLCASCHSSRSCTDCHDGRVRPRQIHSNDWISMHPLAARQSSPRCGSCHRHQSFCVGCHQRAGVAQTGPYANFAGRGRFHPAKSVWTDPPRSARHHAWEAQRNLSACVSCHVERDCAICHATAARGGPGAGPGAGLGQGTNPHPTGFRHRCRTALRKNARPCLVCHAPSDPKLGECR